MTSDQARDEDERARRQALHDVERWAASQPPPEPGQPPADPVHVVRIRQPGQPGADLYALARWSLAARLVRDAADAGQRGQITDLGPHALDVAGSIGPEDLAPGKLLHVGLAKGGKWLAWYPPVPAEPVPGSHRQRGQRD